jgi:L-malate glycosyltransferase
MNDGVIYLYLPWVFDRLGGVDVVVDNLYSFLTVRGIEVRIAEQSWSNSGESLDEHGRQKVWLNFPSVLAGNESKSILRDYASFIKYLIIAFYTLHRHKVRVVNAHFPTPNILIPCVLKRLRLWRGKIVLSFHGSDVNQLNEDSLMWRFILNSADEITACSSALKSKIIRCLGSERWRISVIHNGVDGEKLSKLICQSYSTKKCDSEYIVCVANFVENKRQDVLLEAFAKICRQYPGLELVLAGGKGNGNWAVQLEQQCGVLGIEKEVHFIFDVPHESIPGLLAGAKFAVLPSNYESFGLVIAEAGAVGTPVIASNTGGIPEIITDEQLGILFSVDDINALSKAMKLLLSDNQRSLRLGSNLRKRVLNDFTLEGMGVEYLKILRS